MSLHNSGAVWISKKNHNHRWYPPKPRVILLICTSNWAYLGLLDRISCLALNQTELDTTNRRLVILGTKHNKAEYPDKNEGQLLSSPKPIASRDAALTAPQIWAALNGTYGDWNRPPISTENRKGASHNMAGHALYNRIHKATLMKEINRLVSIVVIKK